MSKSFVVMRGQSAYSDSTTRYAAVGGWMIGNSGDPVAPRERPIRNAGSFSNLYVYVSANSADVTSTVTLQKSQVDTAVTVSYTADQTGIKEDNSNSVSFADTDEANMEVTIPTDPQTESMTIEMVGLEFTPDTSADCVSLLCAASISAANLSGGSTTAYAAPSGEFRFTFTEADVKYRIRKACTAEDFYSYVTSNARTTDTILGTRVNGANGTLLVTYTSGQTGGKEHNGDPDELAVGQDYNYRITTGTGTGTINVSLCSSTLISTDNTFHMLASNSGTAVQQSFNVTNYFGVAGDLVAPALEANAQIYPKFAFTAKELGVYVSANTIITSPTVITVLDNNGDSAITLSYAAAETGLKNDSSNTAAISASDNISIKAVTPNTSGTISFQWMSLIGETAAAQSQSPRSMHQYRERRI